MELDCLGLNPYSVFSSCMISTKLFHLSVLSLSIYKIMNTYLIG